MSKHDEALEERVTRLENVLDRVVDLLGRVHAEMPRDTPRGAFEIAERIIDRRDAEQQLARLAKETKR